MPSIAKGSKVLVSGANGYIAMWVVRTLLERGYLVRGAVRTQDKGEFMVDYFQKLGYGDKFEFFVVEDITKEGAFDEAVKDVNAIEHMATPVQLTAQDPHNVIRPAVQGTVGMLKSAKKNGTQVKRIVVTSSVAAVFSQPEKPTKFSEKDWNTSSTKEVDDLGIKASPMSVYSASKTLAEKAAWDFYNQNKSEVSWDLVTINPTYVFGPAIHDVQSVSSLNVSLKIWYDTVVNDTPKTKDSLSESRNYVDVRDTALSHVLALEKEEAGGERIISAAENYIWQEWLDIANSLEPNPVPSHKFPKGYPEILTGNIDYLVTLDNSKEQTILGIKYKTKIETAKDTLEFLASLGS